MVRKVEEVWIIIIIIFVQVSFFNLPSFEVRFKISTNLGFSEIENGVFFNQIINL